MAKNYTGNFKLSFQILVQNFEIKKGGGGGEVCYFQM